LVGVSVDTLALRTRIQRVGHTEPLNQSGQGKRRYRRTYLSFRGDGPMTRGYWQGDHGGEDELRTYGEDSASRAFGWLKKRRFLAPVGGQMWDAVDPPLHVHGGVHAVELKIPRSEWGKAVKQAARADVFADYRWVAVPDSGGVDQSIRDRCADTGVGLLQTHPDRGVTPRMWPEQCTPDVDRHLLNRYMVERWDVNERVLKRLTTRYERELDPDSDADVYAPDTPNILRELDPERLETEQSPPTANGFTGWSSDATGHSDPPGQNKPLDRFTGDGDD
jgi:hypothetical protein